MSNCEYCGKEHDGKYGSGRFCSKSCARAFSTKEKRFEINKKVSQALRNKKLLNSSYSIMHQCPVCKKKFYTKNRKAIYCSRQCACMDRKGKGGGYRKGSGRSKSGWYKGFWCDSTYELGYLIYCLDNGFDIKRNTQYFNYEYDGKVHKYLPDFIVNNEYIEIKGYHTKVVDIKSKSCNVKVLYLKDLYDILSKVAIQYNKKFTKNYNTLYELYDNIKPKFEYTCSNCQKKFKSWKQKTTDLVFCCRKCVGKYRSRHRIIS